MHFAKQSKSKKNIAILLVVAMLLTIMPVAVFAAGESGEIAEADLLNGDTVGSTPSAIQFYTTDATEPTTALNLFVGDSADITTKVLDENNDVIENAAAEVTLTSDSEAVSYENGKVTANAVGGAVLTANYGEVTATLPISVAAKEVDSAKYDAAIGDNSYLNLQEAVNAVNDGETIQLLRHVNSNIKASMAKSYTLDMNGYTITANNLKDSVFTIENGNITLKNGTITGGQNGINLKSNASLTGEGLTVKNNTGNGINSAYCAVTLSDCKIVDNGSAGLSVSKSSSSGATPVNISGTEISGNSSKMTLNNVTGTITDTKITGNKSGIEFLNIVAPITMKNVNVSENEGSLKNIAIFKVDTSSDFIAQNCVFSNNANKGDIVLLSGAGDKTIENCEFINNQYTGTSTTTYSTVNITNTNADNTVKFDQCKVIGNSAGKVGGIQGSGKGIMTVTDTLIQGNTANSAGGVYVSNGTMTVENTVIKENKAKSVTPGSAGGVHVYSGSFNMISGALYNNTSADKSAQDLYCVISSIGGANDLNVLRACEMNDPYGNVDFAQDMYVWKDLKNNSLKEDSLTKPSSARGYQAISNVVHYVAKIGDVSYITLQEAINAANKGDTIVLTADTLKKIIELTETVTIDKPITIDVNDCTIMSKGEAPIFNVNENEILTLQGKGTLANRIEVNSGGTLNLEGDVNITSNGTSSDTEAPVVNRGTVNVMSVRNELTIYCDESAIFNLTEKGYVTTLNLTQGQKSIANLNGVVGTLVLRHYDKADTIAGEKFKADKLTLIPAGSLWDDLTDPEKAVEDVVMIQGHGQCDQNCIDNSDWKAPNSDHTFHDLMAVAFDKDGNIVLHKTVVSNNFVFLDGVNGDDSNTGLQMDKAVKTFEKATEVLENVNKDRKEPIKEIWILNQVTVSNNETWTLNELGVKVKRAPVYEGKSDTGMIYVPKDADLTLTNITIDGGSNKETTDSLVYIAGGGQLNIGEGAVLQKNLRLNNNRITERRGGAVYIAKNGSAEMTGGSIENNGAYLGGGVYTEGHFTLTGGTIQNNTVEGRIKQVDKNGDKEDDYFHNAGGGVMVAKTGTMTMSGGTVQSNSAYHGGGIALGSDSSEFVTIESDEELEFSMTGGTIGSNKSKNSGGGLFVQENNEADITAGFITNNTSENGKFGGGGIYVNGGKRLGEGYKNGRLTLKNVEITDNTTDSYGGGVAGCPSAEVKIYLQDGGVINNNNDGKDDLYFIEILPDYPPRTEPVFISEYMMGSELYNWKDVETNKLIANDKLHSAVTLHAYADPTTITVQDDAFKVFIKGNHARVNGGGVGTNGDVIIGTAPTDPVTITVDKKWIDDKGTELPGDALNDLPPVTFELYRHLEKQSEKDAEYVGFITTEHVYDTEKGYVWPQAKFTNQPKQNADGETWIYTVKEQGSDKFNGKIEKVADKQYAWLATNTLAYTLKLEKQVSGKPDTKEFEFVIQLWNANDTLYNGKLQTVDKNNKAGEVEFKEGKATVTLQKDAFIQLTNLRQGMKYAINENLEKTNPDKVTITKNKVPIGDDVSGNIIKRTVEQGKTEVVFTNHYGPVGDLKIGKTVTGTAGDKTKDWTFQVKLTGKNLAEQYTYTGGAIDGIAVPADGVLTLEDGIGTITLKHGQFVTINRLPAGTEGQVTELDANKNGYKTTVKTLIYTDAGKLENETVWVESDKFEGKIAENEVMEGAFVNTKNSTPTDPTDPTDPEKPNKPDPEKPPVEITDPDVPLVEPEDPTTEIDEPDVPLVEPGTPVEEIDEPEVPLGDAPKTGDAAPIVGLVGLLVVAVAGLVVTRRKFN